MYKCSKCGLYMIWTWNLGYHCIFCKWLKKWKVSILSEKKYLRFGNIPEDKKSKLHRGDAIIKTEKSVSVWNCVFVNDVPFPILPNNTNEDGMADYFYHLLGNKPVYLVTGTELDEKGSVNEPLLGTDIEIIKEYTDDYEYLKTILKRC